MSAENFGLPKKVTSGLSINEEDPPLKNGKLKNLNFRISKGAKSVRGPSVKIEFFTTNGRWLRRCSKNGTGNAWKTIEK